jgi:CMP/dCMP kinase
MAIITITGDLASGKSLIARRIAAELGAVYFSTGFIQREIAAKFGMTTLELNKYAESHPEIDQEIDDRVRMLGSRDEDLVVDSRMAWHFLPDSFKVFLTTNLMRAAERVIADTERSNEPIYKDLQDAMLKLQERKRSENKRYLVLYNADCAKLSNFDLVIDTTYSVPDDTLRSIIFGFKAWLLKSPVHRYWYSPRSVLPLLSLADLDSEVQPDNIGKPVQVIFHQGAVYVYSGHRRLADALRAGDPYLPVEVIACSGEKLPAGPSAAEYVEAAYDSDILSEWERAFGLEYLAPTGNPPA